VRELFIINGSALAEILPLSEAIAIVDKAMRALSEGQVVAPERSIITVNPTTRLGLMPGAMPGLGRFGLKVVSLSTQAPRHGLSSHQGMMLLFDDRTGRSLAALDCHALTRLRTAAASAVATRALAQPDAKTLAIIGTGDLALPHIEAIAMVRPITRVLVWGRSPDKAYTVAEKCSRMDVTVADSIEAAVAEADIVCTLTASNSPILEGRWLKPGQHVNLVGASIRAAREADDELVARGWFIADSRVHALSQAGELRHAIEQGRVGEDHLKAEIGEVLLGRVPGRTTADQITIYKSLGHVAQDIAVADAALGRAGNSDKVAAIDW
jgi:ornithine cyclodeaminase/alanine dehydrogenase-like protein (mu-crystallin family)